jgi:hypothetical protein
MNRSQKISALIPTVRAIGDDCYTVESLSDRGWRYLVKPRTANSGATCECEDFKRHSKLAGYRCIHIEAVRAHLTAQRASKPKTIKEDQDDLERNIRTKPDAQRETSLALSAEDRYQEARSLIESGNGSEWTEAQALSSWLEMVDGEIERLPESNLDAMI